MIVIVNTKGGSGKSTSARQVLAPWVLNKVGQATIVELDDENHDSLDFTKSAIQSERVKVGKEVNAGFAIDKLMDQTAEGYVIADIGGNRTCSMTLEHLGKSGYDVFIDMIVVPVSSAGQDVINAKKTLDAIHHHMPDYQGKIVLFITRTTTEDVDMVRAIMPDAFALAEQYKLAGPIILPSMNCFAISRYMGMSVWEIAEQGNDLKQKLRQDIRLASNDPERRNELSRLNKIVTESIEAKEYLASQFHLLDTIIDLPAAIRASRGEPVETAKPAKKAASA